MIAGSLAQPVERVSPTELGPQAAVVHDVVAVGRSRDRLEHGREIDMRHAEGGEIGHHLSGCLEPERRRELEAVGRDRRTQMLPGRVHAYILPGARTIDPTTQGQFTARVVSDDPNNDSCHAR